MHTYVRTSLLPLASSCSGAWPRSAEAAENPTPPLGVGLAGGHRLRTELLDLHGSGGRGEEGGHHVHAHLTNAQEGLHVLFVEMKLKIEYRFTVK